MNKSRKLIFVLSALALGLAAPALRAEDEQPTEKKEHHPKGNPGEMLKERLGLTDAQAEQMKAAFDSSREQMKALKENTNLSMEDRKAEMKKIREATQAKEDAILNPEQKAKFDKMREAMKERMRDKRPGQDGANGEKCEKPAASKTNIQ